jgi:hypothetical protein
VDWMEGEAREPEWPTERPALHRCTGCGQERPVDTFEAVDSWVGGQWSLLVRCDECRQVRPLSTPFDEKGKA